MSTVDIPTVRTGQKNRLLLLLVSLIDFARGQWAIPAANAIPGSGGTIQRAAQVGTIISVVVVGIVALIGILIFSQVNDALPSISNTQLDDASVSVTEGFAGAIELVPVVMLVLVAFLVISVVNRMRLVR